MALLYEAKSGQMRRCRSSAYPTCSFPPLPTRKRWSMPIAYRGRDFLSSKTPWPKWRKRSRSSWTTGKDAWRPTIFKNGSGQSLRHAVPPCIPAFHPAVLVHVVSRTIRFCPEPSSRFVIRPHHKHTDHERILIVVQGWPEHSGSRTRRNTASHAKVERMDGSTGKGRAQLRRTASDTGRRRAPRQNKAGERRALHRKQGDRRRLPAHQ